MAIRTGCQTGLSLRQQGGSVPYDTQLTQTGIAILLRLYSLRARAPWCHQWTSSMETLYQVMIMWRAVGVSRSSSSKSMIKTKWLQLGKMKVAIDEITMRWTETRIASSTIMQLYQRKVTMEEIWSISQHLRQKE